MDNEWNNIKNLVRRVGLSSRATFSHFAASYYPQRFEDLEIFIAFEKPWDERLSRCTLGHAAKGDQFSFGTTYSW